MKALNLGTGVNTFDGDDLNTAGKTINDNFTELDTRGKNGYLFAGIATTSTVPPTYGANDRVYWSIDCPASAATLTLTNFAPPTGGLVIPILTVPTRYSLRWGGTAWSAIVDIAKEDKNYRFYTDRNVKLAATDVLFSISLLRYGRPNGSFLDLIAPFSCECAGYYDYILADCTGDSIVLSKGEKTFPWMETDLNKNVFILAEKNNNLWQSDVPAIQSLFTIKDLNISIYDFPENTFTANSILFAISRLRISKNGMFLDLIAPFSCECTGQFDYILADCTGTSEIVLSKGEKTFPWMETDLNKNVFILAEKNDGLWNSQFSPIQSLIDNQEDSISIIEKIVKKDGSIGTDCDYVDIKTALNAITDNCFAKRYIINVLDGDYDYSDDGEFVGIKLKNYVTIKGQSYNTRIIKRDTTFDWGKAAVDKDSGDLEHISIIGPFAIISNNCKCPVHIDSGSVSYAYLANLDLINEQDLGTGDNPADGKANCFALGWTKNDHIILENIRANGKLWGHNSTDTKSEAIFEIINCNARRIQIGDLTSQGQDKIIVRGCNVDVFELLWFSEFSTSKAYIRPSYVFDLEGNNIDKSIVADHAGTHDALTEYYKGKYPYAISGIHKLMNGTSINKGDLVYLMTINTVSVWSASKMIYGIALENSDVNNRVLIQYSGVIITQVDATNPISFGDEVEINESGYLVKRTTGTLVGYAMESINTGTGYINVKLK